MVFAPLHRAVAAGKGFNPLERIVLSGEQLLIAFGILLLGSVAVYYTKRFRVVVLRG